MTKAEAYALSDNELSCAADRCRLSLRRAWENGFPGNLTDLYDLAVLHAEASVRGTWLRPLTPVGWLRLFDECEVV